MHPNKKRRLAQQAVKRSRLDHESSIQAIHDTLISNLANQPVQLMIDMHWRDRAAYRAALKEWIRLGGLSITNRMHRLLNIAREGTIREKTWLVKVLADVHYMNPPQSIIQDSVTYDIQIKVRSLKNKKGRKGTGNPYEWVREDIMSVELDVAPNATRAKVKITEPSSYVTLTTWLEHSMERLVHYDDQLALIEDRLHRACASAHAYGQTPEGRWMGVGFTESYPFMTEDDLKTFREKEARNTPKGETPKQYPS